jgi:hypothetical protein
MTINPPINPIVAISVFFILLRFRDYFFYHKIMAPAEAKSIRWNEVEKVTAKPLKQLQQAQLKLNLVHT